MNVEKKKLRLQIKKCAKLVIQEVKNFLGKAQIEGKFQKLHDDGFWLAFGEYVEREGHPKLRGYPAHPSEWADRYRAALRLSGRYKPRRRLTGEPIPKPKKTAAKTAVKPRTIPIEQAGFPVMPGLTPEQYDDLKQSQQQKMQQLFDPPRSAFFPIPINGKHVKRVANSVVVPVDASPEFIRTAIVVNIVKEMTQKSRDLDFIHIDYLTAFLRGTGAAEMLSLFMDVARQA